MKIVFYSTNSNLYDTNRFELFEYPENIVHFNNFCDTHLQDTFYIVTQAPAFFMPENHLEYNDKIIYLSQSAAPLEVAAKIKELKADLAIAMTFWVAPFDWLTISDALVAEELEKLGIKSICHSLQTALTCFDKNRCQAFFEKNNFTVPKSLFVDHDMFFCAGSNKEVLRNVYKESVFSQLEKMKLPHVIKDTCGLSSYSLAVTNTYGESKAYLNSKKNNSNRLIQEFSQGLQIGIEVYGIPGNYTVLPPFSFSVNKYGITSPKQSIKFSDGQRTSLEFKKIEKEILRLANLLNFYGAAQIDLVYNKGEWTFIEINPRLSGMTRAYACGCELSIYEMLYKSCVLEESVFTKMKPLLSVKLPPQSKKILEEMSRIGGSLKNINQIYDKDAKQEREKGWCEVIFASNNIKEIENSLNEVKDFFQKNLENIAETQRPDFSIFEESELMLKSPLFAVK
ncbi:MAG: ATP-grasp domain-containing protein [Treponema sp.]|nr:ATP-grasp domain-containing protein [Treponema sp.]